MDSYDIDAMWPLHLVTYHHRARKKSLEAPVVDRRHKSIHKDLKRIVWSTAEAVETKE